MSLCTFLASIMFMTPGPFTCPERPSVEVTLLPDGVHVRSSYPIQKIRLVPNRKYTIYSDFSADLRQAEVTFSTTLDPLHLVVETGILGMKLCEEHHFEIPNPGKHRQKRGRY